MGVTSNIDGVIRDLSSQTARLAPNSPYLKESLIRIGLYVSALARLEARRQGILDSGRLINSIRYEFFRQGTVSGIYVGSFNVKYAALHEFGGQFTDQMRRAMFASMRNSSKPERPAKGVIRGNRFRARPYLLPSVKKSRLFIIDTLRAAITFAQTGGPP